MTKRIHSIISLTFMQIFLQIKKAISIEIAYEFYNFFMDLAGLEPATR